MLAFKKINIRVYSGVSPPSKLLRDRVLFYFFSNVNLKALQKLYFFYSNLNNISAVSWGRLAQMVELALWKFLPQREVVGTSPAPGFFRVELKYIPLRRNL